MHDQIYEARIIEAYKIAGERVRRSAPRLGNAECGDIVQEAIIENIDNIWNDDWRSMVCKSAFYKLQQASRDSHKRERLVEELKTVDNRHGNQESRDLLRVVIDDTLDADAWAFMHAIYWERKPMIEVITGDGIPSSTLYKRLHSFLRKLRVALFSRGIEKDNWTEWYYCGIL